MSDTDTGTDPGADATAAKRFQGSADGGAGEAAVPGQLSRADLASMSAEEIVRAQKAGRLAHLLGQ